MNQPPPSEDIVQAVLAKCDVSMIHDEVTVTLPAESLEELVAEYGDSVLDVDLSHALELTMDQPPHEDMVAAVLAKCDINGVRDETTVSISDENLEELVAKYGDAVHTVDLTDVIHHIETTDVGPHLPANDSLMKDILESGDVDRIKAIADRFFPPNVTPPDPVKPMKYGRELEEEQATNAEPLPPDGDLSPLLFDRVPTADELEAVRIALIAGKVDTMCDELGPYMRPDPTNEDRTRAAKLLELQYLREIRDASQAMTAALQAMTAACRREAPPIDPGQFFFSSMPAKNEDDGRGVVYNDHGVSVQKGKPTS